MSTYSTKQLLRFRGKLKAQGHTEEYTVHKMLYESGFLNRYFMQDGIMVIIDQGIPDGEMIFGFMAPEGIPQKDDMK